MQWRQSIYFLSSKSMGFYIGSIHKICLFEMKDKHHYWGPVSKQNKISINIIKRGVAFETTVFTKCSIYMSSIGRNKFYKYTLKIFIKTTQNEIKNVILIFFSILTLNELNFLCENSFKADEIFPEVIFSSFT